MEILFLLALAIAPGIFIIWYIYNKDKYDKEPKRLIVITFFLGALSGIPAGIVEIILGNMVGVPMWGDATGAFIWAFLIVGPVEEIAKYLAVRVKAYRSPEFNEVMDGIVYGVSAAMGFATLENIFYVLEGGIAVGILRALLSVPGHAMWGAIIGYYMGLKKMNPESNKRYVLTGLTIAILFHGAYDFFIFTQTALALLIIPLIIWLYRIYRKRLRFALKESSMGEDLVKTPLTGEEAVGTPATKGELTREPRDSQGPLVTNLVTERKKYTSGGILILIFGIILVSFSGFMALGAIVTVLEEGIWTVKDSIMVFFIIVIPGVLGVFLLKRSRKHRVLK